MAIQRSVAAAQRGLGEARKGLKIQSVFATKKWKERKEGKEGHIKEKERSRRKTTSKLRRRTLRLGTSLFLLQYNTTLCYVLRKRSLRSEMLNGIDMRHSTLERL